MLIHLYCTRQSKIGVVHVVQVCLSTSVLLIYFTREPSELVQELLGLPCTGPVCDLAVQPALVLVRLDEIVEASVAAAEHNILPGSEGYARQIYSPRRMHAKDAHLRIRRTGQKSLEPSPT